MATFSNGDTVRTSDYAVRAGLYRTKPRVRRGIVVSCKLDRRGEELATVMWEGNRYPVKRIAVVFLERVYDNDPSIDDQPTGGPCR